MQTPSEGQVEAELAFTIDGRTVRVPLAHAPVGSTLGVLREGR